MNEYRNIYAGFTAQLWKTDCPMCRGQGQTHIMMCAGNITHGNPVTTRSLDKGLEAI